MTYVVAAILGFHGIVHGMGFVSSWQLRTDVPLMSPTLLRSSDPDGLLLRALGLLWLLPVAGFGLAAVGLALSLPVRPLLFVATLVSLGLCITWWQDAKIGAVVDVAILFALVGTSVVAQLRTP